MFVFNSKSVGVNGDTLLWHGTSATATSQFPEDSPDLLVGFYSCCDVIAMCSRRHSYYVTTFFMRYCSPFRAMLGASTFSKLVQNGIALVVDDDIVLLCVCTLSGLPLSFDDIG